MDELQKEYIREKGFFIEEIWECFLWDKFKNNLDVKKYVRTHFSSRGLFLSFHFCKTFEMM